MRSLMWFRSDLRTADNTALSACAAAGETVALFVISPGEWTAHDVAPVRVEFILRTLVELRSALAGLHIPLVVLQADKAAQVPDLVLGAAKRLGCQAIRFNCEYEVDESRRDAALLKSAPAHGLEAHGYTDQVILEPGSVRTQEGRPFTVCTPFKKAWITAFHESRPRALASLRAQSPLKLGADQSVIPDSLPGFTSSVEPSLWPAGEGAAAKRLAQFVRTRIEGYNSARNTPSEDGTSTLSPYLAVGAISPRQCLDAAMTANPVKRGSALDSGSIGITTWISELIWREFYVHILAAFPRVCMGRAFKPATERIRWSDDAAAFSRWQEGRTGFPIVDAGMRQLAATGWMHNRLRMITAMFLTKDLFIDWRWGERHFMRHLIDGFLASNNGGWQWSASTGTDAAPYFRIFNPVSQSRTCDPTGAFIRRWVPELAGIEGDAVHDPSELPPLARARLNYPEPMVDHAKARQRVMDAFGALKAM